MIEVGYVYKHISSEAALETNQPNWKMVVVPKHLRSDVMKNCHNDATSSRLGFLKTLHRVKELYYWPRMQCSVRRYIRNCRVCSAQKHSNKARPGYMGKPKNVSFPWEVISVDIMGPLPRSKKGNSYLLLFF